VQCLLEVARWTREVIALVRRVAEQATKGQSGAEGRARTRMERRGVDPSDEHIAW